MDSLFKECKVKPVTPPLWQDLETLFNHPGDCRFCWCMWWRIKRKEFDQNGAKGNREAMRSIVESGEVPGLLVYKEGKPVAWVSVGPREVFPVLDRSPVLKRVDDQPVWSIVCFYIIEELREKGLTSYLILSAIEYARSKGCALIEGYPILSENSRDPETSLFTGALSTFLKLGFQEAVRRSNVRVIVRYTVP